MNTTNSPPFSVIIPFPVASNLQQSDDIFLLHITEFPLKHVSLFAKGRVRLIMQ